MFMSWFAIAAGPVSTSPANTLSVKPFIDVEAVDLAVRSRSNTAHYNKTRAHALVQDVHEPATTA